MSHILTRREGPVLHLTLNRPEVRNAMSAQMVSELRDALSQAEGDADVRVVVLRGAGGHFSAGADLKDMASRPRDVESLAASNARFGELCVAFAQAPVVGKSVISSLSRSCPATVVRTASRPDRWSSPSRLTAPSGSFA